jgi:hypothetical protein
MGKISGRKYLIRIVPKYLVAARKSSETIITREEQMNPFQLFHNYIIKKTDKTQERNKFNQNIFTFLITIISLLLLFIEILSILNKFKRIFQII